MKPSSAKAKGRNLQKWVRDQILLHCPQLRFDDVRSTGMGQTGADIQLSTAGKEILPVAIECKNKAKFQAYTYYDQAVEHAKKDKGNIRLEPIVVIKSNHREPLAIIDAEVLIKLLTKLKYE